MKADVLSCCGASVDELAAVVGDEMRSRRKAKGWTRKDLVAKLDRDVSLQTVATWELGTRQVSVRSVFDVCGAMDVQPSAFLASVEDRLEREHQDLHVDLRKLAACGLPELLPAIRWARTQLGPDKPEVARLSGTALRALAELCQMDLATLKGALRATARVGRR